MIPRWKIRLFWTLVFSALISGAIKILDRPEPGLNFLPTAKEFNDYSQKEALKFSIYQVLFDYGIRVDWLAGDSRYKTVRIPADLPLTEPYVDLLFNIRNLGGQLLKAETNPKGDKMVIEVGLNDEALFQLTLVSDASLKRVGGKIAIVIDDFGYVFSSLVKQFLNLNHKITYAILPGLQFSKEIADTAFKKNREIMIHMPMEPKNGKVKKDDYILLTSMSEQEIRERLRKAISAIPHAQGLNNHMGSLATENSQLLQVAMDEIKKAGLFFLDSRTDFKTLAYSWAQKMAVPCSINDTFLDRIQEEPFIRQRLYLLAEIASKNGQAIGIGHPNKWTLKVLQEELPKLERKGFKFVNISKVVK
ncbi:MAG: divergent polysaccharide deacetylase family protein [bacterium]